MGFDGYGPFGGGFGHVVFTILGGLFSLFMFLVAIALIFLLVRFLLVATKAAQIYVAKNSPAAPAKPAATTPATAASTTTATKPVAKPVTKPRTPKPPTTPTPPAV